MARAPKTMLQTAAEMMKIVSKKKGTAQQTHIIMEGGLMKMTDGHLSVGAPIDTNVEFCPSAEAVLEMAKALPADQAVTFAVSDGNELMTAVCGDKTFTMKGIDRSLLKGGVHDEEIAPLSDAIRKPIEVAAKLLDKTNPDPRKKTAFSNAGVLTASNGQMTMQGWHGHDLPPDLPIPIEMLAAIVKVKEPIRGFGYGQISMTVFFESGAYIKCRLQDVQAPDISDLWADYPNEVLDAKAFISALTDIRGFDEHGFVKVFETHLETTEDDPSSSKEFDALGVTVPEGEAYDANAIFKMKSFVKNICFGERTLFATDGASVRLAFNPVEDPKLNLYIPF